MVFKYIDLFITIGFFKVFLALVKFFLCLFLIFIRSLHRHSSSIKVNVIILSIFTFSIIKSLLLFLNSKLSVLDFLDSVLSVLDLFKLINLLVNSINLLIITLFNLIRKFIDLINTLIHHIRIIVFEFTDIILFRFDFLLIDIDKLVIKTVKVIYKCLNIISISAYSTVSDTVNSCLSFSYCLVYLLTSIIKTCCNCKLVAVSVLITVKCLISKLFKVVNFLVKELLLLFLSPVINLFFVLPKLILIISKIAINTLTFTVKPIIILLLCNLFHFKKMFLFFIIFLELFYSSRIA